MNITDIATLALAGFAGYYVVSHFMYTGKGY